MLQISRPAQAAFARRLNYQGRLTDSNGVPLANGNYDMVFSIYDASSGGNLVWTETHNSGTAQVTVTNGLFSVVLGSWSSLNAVDFNGTEYWIQVAVSGTTYSPRQRLTATSNAINADLLDGNDSTFFQQRVAGQCGAGSSIRIINADGTVTCQTDQNTTDHGGLSGLGDDDHTQYFALSQNETVSGVPAFDGGTSGSSAPFTVDSTYLVTNLNADYLDGYHYTSFILDGCTDCLNATEIEDIYVLNTSDTMSGSLGVGTDLTVSGNIIGDIRVDDTRAVNDAPTAFDNEVSFDFKNRATVGVPGSGTYSGMITIAPWGDNSGDASHQLNFNEGGVFWRQGQPDSATWDSWYQIGYNQNLDDRYVNVPGDTMTGNLSIDYAGNSGIELRANAGGTPYLDFSNDAASDYDGRIILTGNDALAIDGADLIPGSANAYDLGSMTNEWKNVYAKGQITGASLSAMGVQSRLGPASSADNQTHQVDCDAGYAVMGVTVWASDYYDGSLTIVCANLGSLMTSTCAWTTPTAAGDNRYHTASCPANQLARGVKAYATGRLDYGLSLNCCTTTSGSYTQFSDWITTGAMDNTIDDCYHGGICPTGTYITDLSIWASSYLDGVILLMCGAPSP